MEMKCVSIIIPVYNVKPHIENCLESVCGQTYPNLEILIVDDGSTDGTIEICEEFEKRDQRIRIFHTSNKGVSHARNLGLDKATGEYIKFVDGDDVLPSDSTRIFIKTIEEKNVDFVISNYTKVLAEINIYFNQLDRPGIYSNKEYLRNTLKDPGHHYYGVVWNKFYRRNIIQKNNIRFIEKAYLGEDFIFNLNYLEYVKNVYVIKKHLYYYNCMNGNTLSRYEKNIEMCKKELENRYLIFNVYKKTFENMGMYEKYQKRVQQYWLIYYARNLYYIKHVFGNWDKSQLQEWCDTIMGSEEIQKCIATVSSLRIDLMVNNIWLNTTILVLLKKILRRVKRIKA